MNFTLKDLLEFIKNNGSGILENSKGLDNVSTSASLPIKEHANWHPHWTITKFKDEIAYENGVSYEVLNIDGNMLLNSGINSIWHLLINDGTVAAYNNANALIGVGDSTVAATPAQTDLQAVTNKLYRGQDVGYPTITNQTISFKSTFGSNDANYTWQEVSVRNSSTGAINLNRIVQNLGVKTNPAVWSITLNISIS